MIVSLLLTAVLAAPARSETFGRAALPSLWKENGPFGCKEGPREGPEAQHQWKNVLDNYTRNKEDNDKLLDAAIASSASSKRPLDPTLPRRQFLRMVNGFFNLSQEHISDRKHYGVEDHWATPQEFFTPQNDGKIGGDCEDFAIAEYFALRRLKIPADQMRIAVVRDLLNPQGPKAAKIEHAVLIVSDGSGRWLVLDSALESVFDDLDPVIAGGQGFKRRYAPEMSFNENGFWKQACPAPRPLSRAQKPEPEADP